MANAAKKEKSALRGLMWSLLGTVLGIALITGGVWGIVKPGDKKKRPSTSLSIPSVSPIPFDTPAAGSDLTHECGKRDARFQPQLPIAFVPVKSKGVIKARVTCSISSIILGFTADDVSAGIGTSYEIWLYNDKRDATRVGEVFTPGNKKTERGDGVGTAYISSDVDTTEYRFLVLVRRDFGDDSDKPAPIGFAADF